MDTEVNFFPRTFNMRSFSLRETQTFFLLIAMDKSLRNQHVIKIAKRLEAEARFYELDDILEEDLNTYNKETIKR